MDSVQSLEYTNKQYLLLESIKETGLNDLLGNTVHLCAKRNRLFTVKIDMY